MERDWAAARAKVDAEALCRVCKQLSPARIEAAHIIARAVVPGPEAMDPLNIVPLCGECHSQYDRRRLDLLPYLTVDEQAFAVICARGIFAANRRITGAT